MTEMKIRIAEQMHEAQGKYVYFLLAVAASAIAFAVQKTEGKPLTFDQIPIGVAVLLWAGSFAAGCFNRAYFGSTLFANVTLLSLQDGSHPNLPPRQYVEAACQGVRDAAEKNSTATNVWGRWQFRLLVAGAFFFLAWHVLQMAAVPEKHVIPAAVEALPAPEEPPAASAGQTSSPERLHKGPDGGEGAE